MSSYLWVICNLFFIPSIKWEWNLMMMNGSKGEKYKKIQINLRQLNDNYE